jgi:hypothetical protein
VDQKTTLRQLGLPGATELVELRPGLRIPPTKYITVQAPLSSKPQHLAYRSVSGGFLVTTCQVEVDFDNRTMTMQVPYQDWLLKSQNAKYLRRLIRLRMAITSVPAVAHFSIALSSPFRNCSVDAEMKKLILMDEIGDQLGLQHGQIMNIAKSVYRVWKRWVTGAEP